MKENFNDFNNEKEYSEEEYEEAFLDSLIDAMMNIFEQLKNIIPEIAEKVKPDYQEFIQNLIEYFRENKTVAGSLNYITSKNPNNLWVKIISDLALLHLAEFQRNPEKAQKEFDELLKELEGLIQKRRRGQDIQ